MNLDNQAQLLLRVLFPPKTKETIIIVNEYFSGNRNFKDKLLNLMIKEVRSEEKL